jgi:DNA (cytosine-5)-methyltransferase 1
VLLGQRVAASVAEQLAIAGLSQIAKNEANTKRKRA